MQKVTATRLGYTVGDIIDGPFRGFWRVLEICPVQSQLGTSRKQKTRLVVVATRLLDTNGNPIKRQTRRWAAERSKKINAGYIESISDYDLEFFLDKKRKLRGAIGQP